MDLAQYMGNKQRQERGNVPYMSTPASDARFDFKKDPRFKRLSKKDRKVDIDERFRSVLENDSAAIDPYGRGTAKKSSLRELKRLYDFQKDKPTSTTKKRKLHDMKNQDDESDKANLLQSSIDDEENQPKRISLTKPSDDDDDDNVSTQSSEGSSGGEFQWNEVSDSSSDDDCEEEDGEPDAKASSKSVWDSQEADIPLVRIYFEEHNRANYHEHGEETKRLALIGCDWDTVTAKDLFVTLHSFLKNAGNLKKVSVYLSDFGKERLEYESVHGPLLDLPKQSILEQEIEESSDDDNEKSLEVLLAFRKYQKEKSKYYYAVVEFDSIETASCLYNELEGVDIEFAIDGIDLRFIPDDIPEFTDTYPRPPESVATELPTRGYEAPASFRSALRHSKVQCTWDETPATRSKRLRKRFSPSELNEMDLHDYLASSSSSDSDNDIGVSLADIELPKSLESSTVPLEAKSVTRKDNISEYRRMLVGESSESDNKKSDHRVVKTVHKSNKEEMTFEIEASFKENVESSNSQPIASKKKVGLTPWEEYLQKKKDKKKQRKVEMKHKKSLNKAEDETTNNNNFNKSDYKFPLIGAATTSSITPDTTNELEILSSDRNKHSNKNPKGKRKKIESLEDKCSEINLSDARFQAVFTDPNFAIDPTNPNFKNTEAYSKLLQEKIKRKRKCKVSS